MNLLRHTRILSVVVGLLLVVAVGLHVFARYSFAHVYASYASVAKRHDDGAYIPAVGENQIRKDLNFVLSRVLAEESTPQDRVSLAKRGLDLIVASESQIDEIGRVGDEVTSAIFLMEQESGSLMELHVRNDIHEIVELSKERFAIIADIRGLSYRANFQTAEIFKRIISDQGILTSEHVAELNELIPAVEAQYNERTNLYADLERTSKHIAAIYDDLSL